MIKNRTAQLVYLSMACAIGLITVVASFGLFAYNYRWDFYIHFTNVSNYFCIAILALELVQTIKKKDDSYVTVQPALKFMGLLGMLITFLVFNIMLAPARDASLNFTINSICAHILIPILYVLDWFLFYERKKTTWKYPFIAMLFAVVYVVFIFIHAAILKFDSSILIPFSETPLIYPYFFLNLEKLGIGGVLMWLGIFFVAYCALGYLFYGLDRISFKKNK